MTPTGSQTSSKKPSSGTDNTLADLMPSSMICLFNFIERPRRTRSRLGGGGRFRVKLLRPRGCLRISSGIGLLFCYTSSPRKSSTSKNRVCSSTLHWYPFSTHPSNVVAHVSVPTHLQDTVEAIIVTVAACWDARGAIGRESQTTAVIAFAPASSPNHHCSTMQAGA